MAGLKLVIPTQFTDDSLPVLPPTPVVLASDSFNRANTAAGTLGVTDGAMGGAAGLAWTGAVQLQIISNQVGATTLTTTRFPRINAGQADLRAEVQILGALGGGVIVRATDDQNYYSAVVSSNGALQLEKRVAGATSTIAGTAAGAVKLGDKVALKAAGNTLKAFINGAETLSGDDVSHPSATSCGIRSAFNDTASRFDNFLVTDI